MPSVTVEVIDPSVTTGILSVASGTPSGGSVTITDGTHSVTFSPTTNLTSIQSAVVAAGLSVAVTSNVAAGSSQLVAVGNQVTFTALDRTVLTLTKSADSVTGGALSFVGNRVGYLMSQDGALIPIEGPIIGAHGFSYNQRGTVLDKLGDCSFTVPLHVARNDALAAGNQIIIKEDGKNVGEFVITTTSEALTSKGREARFTCPDKMEELRKVTVSSGFVGDVGHVNQGPQDPIPSRPAETLSGLFSRLLGLRALQTGDPATAWTAGDLTTIPTGLDGLEFGVYGISIVEALGKLAQDRFCHYKLGPGRSVSMGRFGQDSGIRLTKAAGAPWAAAKNASIRQIVSFSRDFDGNYVNDIIPVGTGNGVQQLTLKQAYDQQQAGRTDPVNFPGYNGAYGIGRRVRWDFGGSDGYEYYIRDQASIARYGFSQAMYQQNSIGPATPAAPDLTTASIALYNAAVAHLLWYKDPHETLTITTHGWGDITDIAGKTIRVVYREVSKKYGTLRDINRDYYVMEVKRAIDDRGVKTDVWTLSSVGRYAQDGFSVFSGALQQMDYFRLTPTIYPTRESIYYDALVAPGFPAVVYLDQDQSVVRMREATFRVTCLPAVAPIQSTATSSTAGAHAHNIIGNLPVSGTSTSVVDNNANGGQYAHGHTGTAGQGAHSTTFGNGNANHGHTDTITAPINSGKVVEGYITSSPGVSIGVADNPPSGTSNLVGRRLTGGTIGVWMSGAGSAASIATSLVLNQTNTNHGHTNTLATGKAGGVSNTSATGGFNPTSDPYSGFAPGVNPGLATNLGGGFTPSINSHGYIPVNGTGQPFGNIATAYTTSTDGAHFHQMAYGYYQDPTGKASGVTILVNGARVDQSFTGSGYANGPYDGAFVVDLAAIGVIPTQGAVTVEFTTATFGRLLIRGKVRRDETTVATHT